MIEEVIIAVVNTLAEEEAEDITCISGRKLKKIEGQMKRFDLGDEAAKLGLTPDQAEGALIAQNTDAPFLLTKLKREAYDLRDDTTGKFKNYDVLFPVVGEVMKNVHVYRQAKESAE